MTTEATKPEPPEGVKDANVRAAMQKLARLVDEELPAGWGFFLMAFPFEGHEGRCNYVANARREDVMVVMAGFLKETLKDPATWMQHRKERI